MTETPRAELYRLISYHRPNVRQAAGAILAAGWRPKKIASTQPPKGDPMTDDPTPEVQALADILWDTNAESMGWTECFRNAEAIIDAGWRPPFLPTGIRKIAGHS